MWFIDTDNVIKIVGLRNVETLEYINDATVTGIVYKLPASSPDVGGVATDLGSGKVGIPCAEHGFSVGDTIRIESTVNYNGEFVLRVETTPSVLAIGAAYVAETFSGLEHIYPAIAGTVSSPLVLGYITGSDGDYVGKVVRTTPFFQGRSYVMCIKEVSGLEQVFAKITDVAGFQGLT